MREGPQLVVSSTASAAPFAGAPQATPTGLEGRGPAPGGQAGRLRICCFVQHYSPIVGGTENQARLLNEELVRRGHTVFVIASSVHGSSRREEINGVQVLRFPFPPLFWRAYGPSAIRFFIRSLRIGLFLWQRRRKFDLIHVHFFREPALVAAFINRFLRKPLLVKVACSGLAGDVHYLNAIHLRPFFHRLLSEIPFAVTVNAESAEEIRTRYPATKIVEVLPNGVDHHKYLPASLKAFEASVRLVYCGRLAPEKDVGTILRAVALLQSNGLVGDLLIAGDGPERPVLERLAVEQNLSSRVRFLGRVDPACLYPAADIYVSASRSEGMPNSLLEAMSSGLVPVCSDIPGHRALIRPGVRGFLFAPGNPAALAAHIECLAADPSLRKMLAENARREIEQTYSILKVAERYEAVYMRLRTQPVKPLEVLRKEEIRLALRGLQGQSFRRALEIGAGGGFHAEALNGIVSSVVLTDVDECRLARSRYPLQVVCRAEQLPFREGSFDLITSSMVWEHLEHRGAANEEVGRVLVTGGRVLHLLPTRLWKTLQLCLYWTELPGRILARLCQRGEDHGAEGTGDGESSVPSASRAGQSLASGRMGALTITSRLAAWLVPPIHGTYATHGEEWKAYGRRAWLKEVGRNFELEATAPLLFYSPYLWTGCWFLGLRRFLGSWGLASARYFVFRKRLSPHQNVGD